MYFVCSSLAPQRVGESVLFQAEFCFFFVSFLASFLDRFEYFEIKSDDYLEDPRADPNREGLLLE